MSFLSKVGRKAVGVIGIGCSLHCFFEYIADFVICSGESMSPTLRDKNILLCNKIAQRFHKIQRNDIVIAVHPNTPKSLICKRIIGVEGDLIIMNQTGNESQDKSDAQTIVIKRGSCWVEGDNRINSTDSRNYGQIPVGLIKSKVIARVWPLTEVKLF